MGLFKKGSLKKKVNEFKVTASQRRLARKLNKSKARAAMFKARGEESVRLARERARLKTERKLGRIRNKIATDRAIAGAKAKNRARSIEQTTFSQAMGFGRAPIPKVKASRAFRRKKKSSNGGRSSLDFNFDF